MSVTVTRVQNKRAFKEFLHFPLTLYKDMPAFVPPLLMDDADTLDPKKNPAYEFCDAAMYLAYKDGKLAGRVAAIVNRKANAAWNHDEVRFGWFDFIDDREVSKALLEAVEAFGRERGMTTILGPLGFTDFDPEGMLVEGFEYLSSMALHHNWPYYKDHMEALGYAKDVDWLEYRIYIGDTIPDKYIRVAKVVEERYGLKLRKITKREVRKTDVGYKLFDLINETYSSLYNFTVLPKKMVDKYVGFYLGVLDLKFVSLVEDKDHNIVGFGIVMPSITRALKKCNGKLFPFGWFHILRAMYWKYEENFEMLLIGVKPEYQKKGVNSIVFVDLMKELLKGGFVYGESNAELESNLDIRSQWGDLEVKECKRRRVYKKAVN
ncbi:MAG: N-acetyltransferase [Bacteroidales bacterium]|nr:N-acetyltransferase [Bacteroidales bacterium]